LWVGIIDSTVVWFAWTYLQPITLRKVDDALGVAYTHGIAGFTGGLLVGIFADPSVTIYASSSGNPITVKGWLYGDRHLFFLQIFAGLTIIIYDALATFIILKVISIFTPLRMSDEELEAGDIEIHEEQCYPPDEGYTRIGELVGVGASTPPGAQPSGSPPTTSDPIGGGAQ